MRRCCLEAIWPTYVDAHLPLTAAERKAIHRDAWRMWMGNRRNIPLYLGLPCMYVVLLVLVREISGWIAIVVLGGVAYHIIRAAAMLCLPAVVFIAGGMVLQRWRFAPLVYEATRRRGYDVCYRCGYWLRGLSEESPRCPECGAVRKPCPEAPRDGGPTAAHGT